MKFQIYKRGQGRYTRLGSGLGWGVVAALGCLALHGQLSTIDFQNQRVGIWVTTMVPVGVFVLLAIFIFWLLNKPSIADFMVDAEGEMKKVSWSSRKEIIVSTTVVISVVIIMGILFFFTDLLFSVFFTDVIGI
jgi:preprotein translocase subunit SecE